MVHRYWRLQCCVWFTVQCFVLAEQDSCNPAVAPLGADEAVPNTASCLLQKQTHHFKGGAVAESSEADARKKKAQEHASKGHTQQVKKHHHQQRADDDWNVLSTKTATSTFDEWADYLVDGTTTTEEPQKTLATTVSDKSTSFFWRLLCAIDFLHWFTPVPGEEDEASNATNATIATTTPAPSNATTTEPTQAPPPAATGSKVVNDTNATSNPHAPLPAL